MAERLISVKMVGESVMCVFELTGCRIKFAVREIGAPLFGLRWGGANGSDCLLRRE